LIFISLILYTHRNHENRGMHFVFYESGVFLNERVCILTLNDANADAAKSVRVWEIIIRMGSLARSNNMLLERDCVYSFQFIRSCTFCVWTDYNFCLIIMSCKMSSLLLELAFFVYNWNVKGPCTKYMENGSRLIWLK